MSEPLVTVVTSTFDRGDSILATVTSVLEQTLDELVCVVVDDGSGDDTMTRLAGLDDPRLRLVSQKNRGLTVTLAEQFARATTPFIALQGAGDLSHRERLETQLAFLEANPDVGAVGCRFRRRAGARVLNDAPGSRERCDRLPDREARVIPSCPFLHATAVVRASAYRRAGGYRAFFDLSQDFDLWQRMSPEHLLVELDGILYDQLLLPSQNVTIQPEKRERHALLRCFVLYLQEQGKLHTAELDAEFGQYVDARLPDDRERIASAVADAVYVQWQVFSDRAAAERGLRFLATRYSDTEAFASLAAEFAGSRDSEGRYEREVV